MIIGVNNSPLALVPFSKSTLANKREIGTQKKGYVMTPDRSWVPRSLGVSSCIVQKTIASQERSISNSFTRQLCGNTFAMLWPTMRFSLSEMHLRFIRFLASPPGQKVLLLAKASSPRTRKSKSVSVSKKTPAATLPSDVHPHINQQLSSINATLSSSLKKCCFLK